MKLVLKSQKCYILEKKEEICQVIEFPGFWFALVWSHIISCDLFPLFMCCLIQEARNDVI